MPTVAKWSHSPCCYVIECDHFATEGVKGIQLSGMELFIFGKIVTAYNMGRTPGVFKDFVSSNSITWFLYTRKGWLL